MGLFDKTVTHVATSVQPLFDDEDMTDPTKAAILRSLVWGTDIFEEFQREVRKGYHTQIDAAFKFAKEGRYAYGLPEITHFGMEQVEAIVLPTLKTIYGNALTLEYLNVGEFNHIFVGFDILYNLKNYQESDNSIGYYSGQVGRTAYLTDLVPHFSQSTYNELRPEDIHWTGPSPKAGVTPIRAYPTPGNYTSSPVLNSIDGVEVVYCWLDDEEVPQIGQEIIPLDAPAGTDYVQAIVKKDDGTHHVFVYKVGSGLYPALDALEDVSFSGTGTYFPIIPFRSHKKDVTDEATRDEEVYASTVKLMEKMGLDYQSICDQIHASPDIGHITQAIMTLAVPGISDKQSDLEYLFKFFSRTADNEYVPNHTYKIDKYGRAQERGSSNYIQWADAGFTYRISFYDLKKKERTGTVTEVGKYILLQGTVTFSEVYDNPNYDPSKAYYGGETEAKTWDYPVMRYCYQKTATTYTEVVLTGAVAKYPINSQATEFDSDEEQFIVPVDMDLVKTMKWSARRDLFTHNLRFVFNAYVVQKLKWYERGFFKVFTVVLAFVALIFGMVEVAVALYKIVTLAPLLVSILIGATYLVKLLILKYLGVVVIKALGVENAFLAALLLLIAGTFESMGFNAVDALSAKNLMALASSIQDAGNSTVKDAYAKYQADSQSFLEESESQLEELAALRKELGLDLLDSPFLDRYTAPRIILGETPDDFFNRTIHTSNVGTYAFKSIEKYVDISLTLPGIDYNSGLGVSIYE